MATDTDMTRRAVRARLLRVCVSQTRSRPERAKTDRTQPHTTRKGNKSRDIATNARLPAIPHRTRQVCIQRSGVEECNGKAQNPIAAATTMPTSFSFESTVLMTHRLTDTYLWRLKPQEPELSASYVTGVAYG
ncbi:hypothetical protein Q7P36_001790 [Cladosporium allicinum]